MCEENGGNCNTILSRFCNDAGGTADNEWTKAVNVVCVCFSYTSSLYSLKVGPLPFAVNVNEGSAQCYFRFPAKIATVRSWTVIALTRKTYLKLGKLANFACAASILNYAILVIRIHLRLSTEICSLDFRQISNSSSIYAKGYFRQYFSIQYYIRNNLI